MSFRELRQFTEIIRVLGYPQPIGIDSFDTPNFGTMANLLQWLATSYDPEIVLLPDLTNESGRVDFIKTICQQMAIRSGIRLNPRKLYCSDRQCVRELLKIAAPIYQGIVSPNSKKDGVAKNDSIPSSASKISRLSSTIPQHSVQLYDALKQEIKLREPRVKVLSTMPPLDQVESQLQTAVTDATTRLDSLTKDLDRLNEDEDSLRSKIKTRKHELERQTKRLMSVQTIRPAFMDEYEVFERELQDLFKIYNQQYRNVDFYEKEIQKQTEKKQEEMSEIQKKLIKLREKAGKTIASQVAQSYQNPGENFLPGQKVPDSDTELMLPQDDSDEAF